MTLHQKHHLRFILIAIATIFYFLANIQRVAIPGAIFDLLQSDYNAGASKITLLGAIFCYVYAITQLVVGLMVDKLGGFRVAAIGAVVFSFGAIIFPHSHSILGLYLSRALVGFGAATFYISTVREVKKYSKDKNFSLAISYILFIGYSGGIVANAPFVMCAAKLGWRNSLYLIAFFTLFLAILYLIVLFVFKPVHIEKKTEFSLSPFREVLSKSKNIDLFIFGSINYGLYYVLQSVIGKKFLEDFCFFNAKNAAIILSVMAVVSAFAGTISACISKCMNGKRAPLYKVFALLSVFSTLSVCIFLALGIHTKIIALIFLIPSFIGSISPLLILSIHFLNRYEVSATAVSIQNFSFFMMVGFLGMICGILMNVYEPKNINGILTYSNQSYLLVFFLFFILSLIELFYALKIKDGESE